MRGEAGRERMGGEGRGGAGRKEEAGRGRGRRQGTALAPRVSSRSLMLLEVTEDVTSSASGGPQTMFALLGATTLVLVAGVPWMLPAAAGERRGVPGPGPGRGERLGGGGRWKPWPREAGVLSGRPLLVRGHSVQIENLEAMVFQGSSHGACLGASVPVPAQGTPSPPALWASPAGVLGEREPSCGLRFSSKNPVTGLDP